MRRRFLVSAFALLLAACETRETTALNAEIERLRAERDKLATVAGRLDEYREESKRVSDALARTVETGALLEHEKRVDRAAAVPGVTRTAGGPGVGWALTGTAPETLRQVCNDAGAMAVEAVGVNATGWRIKVPAYDYAPPLGGYATPGVHLAPPTPAPGRFVGRRSLALRAEIDRLRAEVAELERLVGPLSVFEQDKAELTMRSTLLESPSRLAMTGPLALEIFTGAGAVCRTGTVVVSRESVRFFCAPRAADPDSGADAVRALFGPGSRWKLGPLSIDASNPEPIQASLTRAP